MPSAMRPTVRLDLLSGACPGVTVPELGKCHHRGYRASFSARLARSRAQVWRVAVVPVATLNVKVEVARSLECHAGRRRAGCGPTPAPSPDGLLATSPTLTTCTLVSSATTPGPSTKTRCWPLSG